MDRICAGLAALAVLALAACQQAWTPERVREDLRNEPSVSETAAAFERYYPQDYDRLLAQLADAANSGGERAARQQAFSLTRQFMISKSRFLLAAPDADLAELADRTSEFVHALRAADLANCARFVTLGFGPNTQLAPALLSKLGGLNALQLKASRNGETAGRAPRGEPNQEAAAAWTERVEQLDPRLAPRILDGSLMSASPPEQCDGGIAVYQAIADLPDDQSASVFAAIIREALAPSPTI